MAQFLFASRRRAPLRLGAAVLVGLAACTAGTDSVSGPTGAAATAEFSWWHPLQTVASVSVTPQTSTMNIAQTLQFTAVALSSSGAVITGKLATWTSSDTTVVTVNATGLATAKAAGSATVTATISGKAGHASVTVAGTVAVSTPPGTVANLSVVSTNDTSATLTFTQVTNGTGGAASYDVRYAVAPISWGSAASTTRGTCTTPLAGTTVGSAMTCTVLGLTSGTSYNFQVVAFRGTLNQNAVFGGLSNVAAAVTTTASTASTTSTVGAVAVTPSTASATVGTKLQLAATVKDKNGNVLTGSKVAWASSNTSIATVDTTGTVMGVVAGTVTISATVSGVSGTSAVTEASATQTQSGTTGLYPNQPAGYTRIAETDYSALPEVSMLAGKASGASRPASLETIVSGSSLPVTFPVGSGHALQHIIEAGTPAGYEEAGSDGAGFNMWQLGDVSGANGGPSDTEYSAFYQSTWFSVYGNGSTIETPAGPGIKMLGYWGVSNNNQNASGPGPTELYIVFSPVSTAGTAPLTTSEMHVDFYLQNGPGLTMLQNLNTSKTVVVGKVHQLEQVFTLGTAGVANGTVDWWLDGVHIGSYNNVPFISSSFAKNGGDGLSGFWGWQFTPWWGGSGGPNKTRNDALYVGYTYISGIFLRNKL